MKQHTTIWFLSVVFGIPALAFAFFVWYEKKLSALPVLGGKEHRVTGFQLTNKDGSTYKYEGEKITVACFFFTHCPGICPAMMKNLKKVEEQLKDEKDLSIISITVDPERDSPDQLRSYSISRKINYGNWDFLTGDKRTIYALARNSFKVVATDGDGGPADFIHSEKLVLIDKQKRIRGYYDGTNDKETDQLIDDIKKLKNEN